MQCKSTTLVYQILTHLFTDYTLSQLKIEAVNVGMLKWLTTLWPSYICNGSMCIFIYDKYKI